MKIAVVSTGLGHVARGIEAWADDLGTALHRAGVDVTLFKGGGQVTRPFEQVVRCAQRDRPLARRLARLRVPGGWRYGFGSAYQIEQETFAWTLIAQLSTLRIDIVHMQDPWLAHRLERARQRGRHHAHVILAHGTEEPFEFLTQFEHVQELAPYYLEQDLQRGLHGKHWFAIPNFVDVTRFSPDVVPLPRARFGIPDNALLILSVSAIKRAHKRVDYLINEIAQFRNQHPEQIVHYVVAGAREPESSEVFAHGKDRLGTAVTFLPNFNRQEMPALLRMADVFVHGALLEMMPIALLEATASGLPVIAHNWPVIQWIVGDGGTCTDTRELGAMATAITPYLKADYRRAQAIRARKRAIDIFSADGVVPQIIDMYRQILKARKPKNGSHQP